MPLAVDLKDFSQQLLRNITKDLSRDAEKIAKTKINEKLNQGNSNQSIELDIQHTFRISNGKELPDAVITEIFNEAVQEALSGAFSKLRL